MVKKIIEAFYANINSLYNHLIVHLPEAGKLFAAFLVVHVGGYVVHKTLQVIALLSTVLPSVITNH